MFGIPCCIVGIMSPLCIGILPVILTAIFDIFGIFCMLFEILFGMFDILFGMFCMPTCKPGKLPCICMFFWMFGSAACRVGTFCMLFAIFPMLPCIFDKLPCKPGIFPPTFGLLPVIFGNCMTAGIPPWIFCGRNPTILFTFPDILPCGCNCWPAGFCMLDCTFMLESATVARKTRFLCKICWYCAHFLTSPWFWWSITAFINCVFSSSIFWIVAELKGSPANVDDMFYMLYSQL